MADNNIDTKPEAPWAEPADGKHISSQVTLIGSPPNHWLHDDETGEFDLTRSAAPDFPRPRADEAITIKTTTSPVVISPKKTALVIIDMQNFFLSPALGRSPDGAGNKARQRLLDSALPSARIAGIQVIWLNWGLTQEDIDSMPASILRAFGFKKSTFPAEHSDTGQTEINKPRALYRGLGSDMGPIKLEDGTAVDGGRLLFRESWNADLPPDLKKDFQNGLQANRPDIWVHKNRMSGLWGTSTPCTEYLEKEDIRTLIFAGVNTDQCVAGSLQDAYSKGYDCILLTDCCGTTSPDYATQCVEYNTARSWGFVTDCPNLQAGVNEHVKKQSS